MNEMKLTEMNFGVEKIIPSSGVISFISVIIRITPVAIEKNNYKYYFKISKSSKYEKLKKTRSLT